jgi:hypothetical protein
LNWCADPVLIAADPVFFSPTLGTLAAAFRFLLLPPFSGRKNKENSRRFTRVATGTDTDSATRPVIAARVPFWYDRDRPRQKAAPASPRRAKSQRACNIFFFSWFAPVCAPLCVKKKNKTKNKNRYIYINKKNRARGSIGSATPVRNCLGSQRAFPPLHSLSFFCFLSALVISSVGDGFGTLIQLCIIV